MDFGDRIKGMAHGLRVGVQIYLRSLELISKASLTQSVDTSRRFDLDQISVTELVAIETDPSTSEDEEANDSESIVQISDFGLEIYLRSRE